MSDATRCGYCGWVYWTHATENWGTCTKCDKNNDHADDQHRPALVDSSHIFTYYDPLLMKAEKAVKENEDDNKIRSDSYQKQLE